MNLGRFTLAIMVACAFGLAVAGCGGSATKTVASATQPTGASKPTGATGRSGGSKGSSKRSGSSKQSSGKKAKAKSGASSSGSGLSGTSPSSGSGSGANSGSAAVPPPVSAADKAAVSSAFNKMIDALDKQNVKYLCGSAYSSEFLAQLEKQGGCTKVTEAGLASLTGYSASIVSVLRFPGTKLIGVSAKLRPESQDSKPRTGTIYFKRQAGAWKRAVPPKA